MIGEEGIAALIVEASLFVRGQQGQAQTVGIFSVCGQSD
jgi:hypothetical protein